MQDAREDALLELPVAEDDVLLDVGAGTQLLLTALNPNWVRHAKLASQSTDLRGPRGRPHEHLPVVASGADDLSDLSLESSLAQPVGLVQDDERRTVETHLPLHEQVHDAAGGGDADLLGRREEVERHGAVAADALDGAQAAVKELLALLVDLLRQLTCGRENERDGPVALLELRLGYAVRHARQKVRQRLARTSLCDADHVAAAECDGPPLHLNGPRLAPATVLYDLCDLDVEACLLEGPNGPGAGLALHIQNDNVLVIA
mmetsp:Transcript_22516/g.55504  ORF Transcript_22516/g.55504 Transcript_22516/m.55504 type:complete len:261 (+) Transcript_22516:1462-2244(+)